VRRQPDAGISGGRAAPPVRRPGPTRALSGPQPWRRSRPPRGAAQQDTVPRRLEPYNIEGALIPPAASTLTAAMGAALMKWSARRSLAVIPKLKTRFAGPGQARPAPASNQYARATLQLRRKDPTHEEAREGQRTAQTR
jgi:hypothetical protein